LPKSPESFCERSERLLSEIKLTKWCHRGKPLHGTVFQSASGPRDLGRTSSLATGECRQTTSILSDNSYRVTNTG
jgi:hypothetical protein